MPKSLLSGTRTRSLFGSSSACSAAIGKPESASALRIDSSEPATTRCADRAPEPFRKSRLSISFPSKLFAKLFALQQRLKELRLVKIRLPGFWQEGAPIAARRASSENGIEIPPDF